MNYCSIGNTTMRHVLEWFPLVSNLKELYLRGLNLTECNKAVGKNLANCKRLEIIDISENNIKLGDQRVHDSLQDMIANTKRLKQLNMEDTELNEDEARNYLDSLHMNASIIDFAYTPGENLSKETRNNISKELNVNTLIEALILPHYSYEHPHELVLSHQSLRKVDFIVKFIQCKF